jgi:hypothetical protein
MFGWPYLDWPYASYYGGWPYYPAITADATIPPEYNEPEQPQYLPPPPPPSEFNAPPAGVYPPPATGEPGTGNISPPPTTSQITPTPNQKRCQKWAPTGEFDKESRWNPQTQTMETVSVPNFAWQDIPCQ